MGTLDPVDKVISAHLDLDVVLFDGVCNLCNASVRFVIKRDGNLRFKFASLQSSFAQNQLVKFTLEQTSLRSIVLIRDQQLFEKSDAVLEIVRYLSKPWPMLYAFKIIPKFIRDVFYNFIAKNRYRIFGKRESCMVPTPELEVRFIQ